MRTLELKTQEIRRVYRLDFTNGELLWDDPMPPETTAQVLGPSASVINRTSLLAWSLMSLPEVDVADLAFSGWMMMSLSTGADFDDVAFQNEVAEIVRRVKHVRRHDTNFRGFTHSPIVGSFPTNTCAEARAPI
jgi:hypothetical protein